jgi:hypothetical protein
VGLDLRVNSAVQEVSREFNSLRNVPPPRGLQGWKARCLIPVELNANPEPGSLHASANKAAVLLAEAPSDLFQLVSRSPACDINCCGAPIEHGTPTPQIAQLLRDTILEHSRTDHVYSPAGMLHASSASEQEPPPPNDDTPAKGVNGSMQMQVVISAHPDRTWSHVYMSDPLQPPAANYEVVGMLNVIAADTAGIWPGIFHLCCK